MGHTGTLQQNRAHHRDDVHCAATSTQPGMAHTGVKRLLMRLQTMLSVKITNSACGCVSDTVETHNPTPSAASRKSNAPTESNRMLPDIGT